MKRDRTPLIIGVILALAVAALAVTSCEGEETTTTVLMSTTSQQVTTTVPTTTTTEATGPEGIRAALQASDLIADDFEISDFIIMPEWAGAVVSAPMAEDARVLLQRSAEGWEVVAVFSDMSRQELVDCGAPEAIAVFLAGGSTSESGDGVSAESLAYAEGLGGISHEREALYVVIGASVETETQAQILLREALPFFGDMQPYFIVQRSDNFEGLEPGWWVVMEAYYADPDGDQLDFCRRGFPDAYVKQVTVLTSDPLPVYEDMPDSPTLEIIRDAIAQSGDVAVDFEIDYYLIRGDWAGVIISGPDLEFYSVLLLHSGLVGWAMVDMGTGLLLQDLLDAGAPPEIANFLACDT